MGLCQARVTQAHGEDGSEVSVTHKWLGPEAIFAARGLGDPPPSAFFGARLAPRGAVSFGAALDATPWSRGVEILEQMHLADS